MRFDENKIADALFIVGILSLIIFAFVGCSSVKLSHQTYHQDGTLGTDTQVRYDRFLNQEIEGLEIANELFTARMEEQAADNTEAVGAISSGVVEGIGKVVVP